MNLSEMNKIILLGLLLATVLVHAHAHVHYEEDWYEATVDEEDSLHESGSGMVSGTEVSGSSGTTDDVYSEVNSLAIGALGEDSHGDDFHYEEEEEYDGDQWESKSHERKRRYVDPCAIGCHNCSVFNLYCNQCKSGYKQKGAGCIKMVPNIAAPINKVHKSCTIVGCLNCSPFNLYCQKCQRGYKNDGVGCTKIVPNVAPPKGNTQHQCPSMPGCEQCTNSKTCKKCTGSLILHHNFSSSECVTKCPYSYDMVIKNGKRICKQQDGCLDPQCKVCKSRWFRADYKGRLCHKGQCPPGFRVVWKLFCAQCPKGCNKCNANGCEVCNQGLSLHKQSLIWGVIIQRPSCLSTCPKGFKRVLVQGKGDECHKDRSKKIPATGSLP